MDHRCWHYALFTLCICFGLAQGTAKTLKCENSPPAASSLGVWCVARKGASEKALQRSLNYACNEGGADCSAIVSGAACYKPNNIRDHASYVFNDYYHKNPTPAHCVFGGTAILTNKDPSSGDCHYASSPKTSISPPAYVGPPSPATPTPLTPTPPDVTDPGSSGNDSEPRGFHNAATSAFCSLLLLFASGVLASLQVANYI